LVRPNADGRGACENPPERIRKLWRLDDRPKTLVAPIVVDNRPDGITPARRVELNV
jgi:hypothetical protein